MKAERGTRGISDGQDSLGPQVAASIMRAQEVAPGEGAFLNGHAPVATKSPVVETRKDDPYIRWVTECINRSYDGR